MFVILHGRRRLQWRWRRDDVQPYAAYRKADNNYTGQYLRKMQRSAGSHDRCPMACLQMDGGGEKINNNNNNIIFSRKV